MTLRRCGLVRSQRGAKGGYLLAREPCQITLLEVLACLEGTKNLAAVAQTASPTPENSVLEEVWQEASNSAIAVLQRYTLQDLCEKRSGAPTVEYHVLHLAFNQVERCGLLMM